jgi:arginine decarboxylase
LQDAEASMSGNIPHDRFNQSYMMMHATTPPLYAIIASNDNASAMIDDVSGTMLNTDVIKEAVSFRQAVARNYKRHQGDGDCFFKPWNADVVKDPIAGMTLEIFKITWSCSILSR